MKLYYYIGPTPNFGDDLNPWLWPKLLPAHFDDDERTIFVGIGTILNTRIPKEPTKIIFGSGYGYGSKPIIDDKWLFYCVRGPMTAEALGLDSSLAVTDPAILVRTLSLPLVAKKYKISYMPHVGSIRYTNWEEICRSVSIHYIAPTLDVDETLEEILSCELLLTEALHGAIVAHALEIPWLPIRCYGSVLTFKWIDWFLSVNLKYEPIIIHGVKDVQEPLSFKSRLKDIVKKSSLYLGFWNNKWGPLISTPRLREKCAQGLIKAADNHEPIVGNKVILDQLTDRLLVKLELIKKHYCKGWN